MHARGLVPKPRLQQKPHHTGAPDPDEGWMLRVLQGAEPVAQIRAALDPFEGLDFLLDRIERGNRRERNKALAVLASLKEIPPGTITRFLHIGACAARRYHKTYELYGINRLFKGFYDRPRKADDEHLQNAVFATLHAPPSAFGLNRTTWCMRDLKRALSDQGHDACRSVIRHIIRAAGYTFRKARMVLTSHDPEYRAKLANIQGILSTLGSNDRFFSIDEFGPFAVKSQPGRSLMPPGKVRLVPQRQKSKGKLIVTGALELCTNQVTHFYSERKNTAEMIRLLNLLARQYRTCDTIYFSWDAASWHASKRFHARVAEINSAKYRASHRVPRVELAPLPVSAQFLNVIESVYSGMARAVIHNSDYDSVDACKEAIDKHFAERNAFFKAHPKRAGKLIWGQEITPSEFSPGNNCKHVRYCYFGL